MRTLPLVSIACAALLSLAGCGSSGGSSSSSGGSTSTSTAPGSSLKATTTPKFAKPSSSAPVQSGTVEIAYRNIAIDPDTVRVKAGSTVRWTNFDSVEHNVTSIGAGPAHISSGTFGEGKSFEVKLTKPGILHYECTIHPATMNGTIEVVR
jgi:plastocyanin